ncbi:hypothetical protein VTN77DRAFT_9145 [Rasamsonia byssochlamydoides]|uniref:uncharacterized protein n=1 Tax=Rasamsonia byssochlamydoides TaxID=89139 RepID=UPI0037437139
MAIKSLASTSTPNHQPAFEQQDPIPRRTSCEPGSVDTDDGLSPLQADFDDGGSMEGQDQENSLDAAASAATIERDDLNQAVSTDSNTAVSAGLPPHDHDDSSSSLHLPPAKTDTDDSTLAPVAESSLLPPSEGDTYHHNNRTLLDEKEMRRKLMDMESSFLPEPSTIGIAPGGPDAGADDTYLVGVAEQKGEGDSIDADGDELTAGNRPEITIEGIHGEETIDDPEATPAAHQDQEEGNTSALETLDSSPTAAAAAGTVSRVLSNASNGSQHGEHLAEPSRPETDHDDIESTPKKSRRSLSPAFFGSRHSRDDNGDDDAAGGSTRTRPRYLTSRQSSHRFSTSSVTSTNTDTTASDATLGADYALQSGGAVPGNSSGARKDLARSISLGSMASGISGYSDENVIDKRALSSATDGGLHTLDEEEPTSPKSPSKEPEDTAPVTPKAGQRDLSVPTDTVIAERVQDIQVPGTFARQFREKFAHSLSPDKRPGAPTPGFGRSGKSMTLKEQSSTIDRLSKENFDLKMRIHFLNEALNKRSEEGIKEMISENVELKSDKLKLQKENQGLKRTIRDLEKQLKDQQSDKEPMENHDDGVSDDEDRNIAAEEEILFLKERIETYEMEIERLRSESLVRESEKRRLAEMVKSLGEGRTAGSDVGAREERDMWKDMLDAETAAREQAEEENRKLREEVLRLKVDLSTLTEGAGRLGRGGRKSSVVSHATTSDLERRLGVLSSTSSTLVELELLKQENAELRREVSAQTSMLTSRNREKERLYQEIEDLKLQRRSEGSRSAAGDSIFERSASRSHARSSSRASNGTRSRAASDAERENLEIRNGELRDQVSALKLENQGLRSQLDEYASELEALDKAYQADVEQAEEEIETLQQERDHALQLAEERELALQELKNEAQEEIDALGDELDQKIDECQRLEAELRNQEENLKALQAEMRSASEGIIRLEEDAQSNLRKYKAVQQELDDANKEIESLEKNLFEANNKVQRLTVQLESSQNEISFLREEQDGDKIKISDLESELKTCQMNLQSEKEKTRELETRLSEERHQREVVAGKEKQEVQRIMNELNREASAAKDEVRKLKKALSAREIEATTWKERLMDLENGLREALGDLNGTRSSLLNSITKLQKELESTALELESTRAKLDEKEALLQNRDALLESHGLESRKLAELLERERQARRADKHSFEQALKSQQQASRTITQNNSRITDLENARSQDRKRFASIEQQLKDQLSERNTLFLTLWKRLSAMCGPDWAHSNSLINGNLPSVEVIGNILFWPGFSRNLLLAVKTVEGMMAGFKNRIKAVERDLTKEYQSLEHNLGLKIKKLDRLEEAVRNMRSQQRALNASPELSKLRGENRLLKAELNLIQSHSRSRHGGSGSTIAAVVAAAAAEQPESTGPNSPATLASTLVRHQSAPGAENQQPNKSMIPRTSSGIPQPTQNTGAVAHPSQRGYNNNGSDPNRDRKWIERLRELERRLKAEREARLLDRSGARKRLEERDAENEELRAQLERERMRRSGRPLERGGPVSRSNSQRKGAEESGSGSEEDEEHASGSEADETEDADTHSHSSYTEGITVDIEV